VVIILTALTNDKKRRHACRQRSECGFAKYLFGNKVKVPQTAEVCHTSRVLSEPFLHYNKK